MKDWIYRRIAGVAIASSCVVSVVVLGAVLPPLGSAFLDLAGTVHVAFLDLVHTVHVAFIDPAVTAQELDIREATFRYQFRQNASDQQQRARNYYYLSVEGDGKQTDPDDTFVKRFTGNNPPVKKVSESGTSLTYGVVDKKTGYGPGKIFHAGAIKWVSDTEVEVSGGRYTGPPFGAEGGTYYLRRVDGKWKVTNYVVLVIS